MLSSMMMVRYYIDREERVHMVHIIIHYSSSVNDGVTLTDIRRM